MQSVGVASSAEAELPFAQRSPLLLAAFRWYLHCLFWRRFSAVRLARAGQPQTHHGRPLVIYTNHPSWWDPALFMLVSPKLFPGRVGIAPMDAAQLQRYALFRRFGAFGLHPGARGAATFLRTARLGLARPDTIMWITAEGAFCDPRQRPVNLRPGIAHLMRQMPDAVFLPAALDYVFWNESRPEALIRFGAPIATGGAAATIAAGATQALTDAMDALAGDSAARDPARFITLLKGTAGSGLIYDSWQRLKAWRHGRAFDPRHEAGRL